MPSLSTLKDVDLKDGGIRHKWKISFEDDDWKQYCPRVLNSISRKKYDLNELENVMKDIIRREVEKCFSLFMFIFTFMFMFRVMFLFKQEVTMKLLVNGKMKTFSEFDMDDLIELATSASESDEDTNIDDNEDRKDDSNNDSNDEGKDDSNDDNNDNNDDNNDKDNNDEDSDDNNDDSSDEDSNIDDDRSVGSNDDSDTNSDDCSDDDTNVDSNDDTDVYDNVVNDEKDDLCDCGIDDYVIGNEIVLDKCEGHSTVEDKHQRFVSCLCLCLW